MLNKATSTAMVISFFLLGKNIICSDDRYETKVVHCMIDGQLYYVPVITKIEVPMDQNYEPIEPKSSISHFTPEMREEATQAGKARAGLRSYLNTSVTDRAENTETIQMLVPQSLSNSYSAARGYKPY